MKTKNQHYVPQFHLRQWSSDGKLISLYNKYNKVFVDNKGSIKKLASCLIYNGHSANADNFFYFVSSVKSFSNIFIHN